jgi:predicted PurR-regulated permease PerM
MPCGSVRGTVGMKMRFDSRVQPEKPMSNRTVKKAPLVRLPQKKKAAIVRLPPKSGFELFLAQGSQVAAIFMGAIAFVFALHAGEYILAPVAMGVVLGLMLGPLATTLERRGLPPGLSAFIVFVLFIGLIGIFAAVVLTPLSLWVNRLPQIWQQLQGQLAQFQEPIASIGAAREELRKIVGGGGLTVSVDEGSPVESVATLAPALLAQILIFLASLYFFVATRHQTRLAILKLCFTRRLRWRVAHIFRDVEALVSRYLLSISLINVAEGVAVGIGLWLAGVPSAALWGALAVVSNFIVFLGPLLMTIVLFVVGLTEFDTIGGALVPPLIYQAINVLESQFVTPMVIGRALTLNPFVVVLALVFWIWLWGALGGFIAIPALLICYAMIRNMFPGFQWAEPIERR